MDGLDDHMGSPSLALDPRTAGQLRRSNRPAPTHSCPLSQTRPTARSIPDGTATETAIGSCLSPLDTESRCFCPLGSGRCKRWDQPACGRFVQPAICWFSYIWPPPRSCKVVPVHGRSGVTSQTREGQQSIRNTSYLISQYVQ